MTLPRTWISVLGLAAMLVETTPALAQRDLSTTQLLRERVAGLSGGASVRISADGLRRIRGELRLVTGDTLLMNASGTELAVSLNGIDTLWVRQRPVLLRGALGAVAGATLGAAVFLVINALCSSSLTETPCSKESQQENLRTGTFQFAVIGLGAGVLAGAAFPRWRRRFP